MTKAQSPPPPTILQSLLASVSELETTVVRIKFLTHLTTREKN